MPYMDGLALLRRIRKKHPKLPVLLISGAYLEPEEEEEVNTAPTMLLKKPVDFAEVEASITSILR